MVVFFFYFYDPIGYIEIIEDMYEGAVMSMGTTCEATGEFPMTIGSHRVSTLSPYLFTLIMDELTTHSRGGAVVYVFCR